MDTSDGRSTARRGLGALVVAGLVVASVACSDSGAPGAARDVSLSFATKVGVAAGAGQPNSEVATGESGGFTAFRDDHRRGRDDGPGDDHARNRGSDGHRG